MRSPALFDSASIPHQPHRNVRCSTASCPEHFPHRNPTVTQRNIIVTQCCLQTRENQLYFHRTITWEVLRKSHLHPAACRKHCYILHRQGACHRQFNYKVVGPKHVGYEWLRHFCWCPPRQGLPDSITNLHEHVRSCAASLSSLPRPGERRSSSNANEQLLSTCNEPLLLPLLLPPATASCSEKASSAV